MSWAVVVPTNRPESFRVFADAWTGLFRRYDVHLVVVQDLPDEHPEIVEAWRQARLLGYTCAHPPIPDWIPRGTDMIRSWGIHQAWKTGADYTLSLDDDVLPAGDLFAEYETVFEQGAAFTPYLDVGQLTDTGLHMRGFPRRARSQVAVQYGGWYGVPDLDGQTQLDHPTGKAYFERVVVTVPAGAAVTGCAMNMAWQTRYAPLMWQLPLLDGRYNRWGDIWSALVQKRCLDELGECMIVNGKASVRHERASDPQVNMLREAPGLPVNEHLWWKLQGQVRDTPLLHTYERVTDRMADFLATTDAAYANHFRACRDEWLSLFA